MALQTLSLIAKDALALSSIERARVIFDVETLLLDPLPGMADSIGWAMIEIGQAPTLQQMHNAGMGCRPISNVLATLLETDDGQIIASACERYHKHYNESGRFRCILREGAVEVLQQLSKDARFELHYLTHLGSRDASKLLSVYGLANLPSSVVTLGQPTCPGIRLPLMKYLVEQSEVGARSWILLSDHPLELLTAQQLGIRSIALGYGRCTLASLCALSTDAVAGHPAEVPALLRVLRPISCAQFGGAQSNAMH